MYSLSKDRQCESTSDLWFYDNGKSLDYFITMTGIIKIFDIKVQGCKQEIYFELSEAWLQIKSHNNKKTIMSLVDMKLWQQLQLPKIILS